VGSPGGSCDRASNLPGPPSSSRLSLSAHCATISSAGAPLDTSTVTAAPAALSSDLSCSKDSMTFLPSMAAAACTASAPACRLGSPIGSSGS
jgi:hypothetical protein